MKGGGQTPVKFRDAIEKAYCDLFITRAEADEAIRKFNEEFYAAMIAEGDK